MVERSTTVRVSSHYSNWVLGSVHTHTNVSMVERSTAVRVSSHYSNWVLGSVHTHTNVSMVERTSLRVSSHRSNWMLRSVHTWIIVNACVMLRCVLCYVSEPAEWLLVAQVQEWVWLAEIVGRFHQFLSLFLQVPPGKGCRCYFLL